MDLVPPTARPRVSPNVGLAAVAVQGGEIRQRADDDDEQNYERVDDQTDGPRPSSPGRATAIVHVGRDVEGEGHYETVDDGRDGARPSSTRQAAANDHADRDVEGYGQYVTMDDQSDGTREGDGQYEIVDDRSDGARPSASHDPPYTDECKAPNYDQLAVQYHNTGDVRPYQQWSVADNGRDGQMYKNL